jgi:hypothetical protein
MSTWGDMKAQIVREMKRGEMSVSATAIPSAMAQAIRFWQNDRFWFNEFVENSFSASASTTYVSLPVSPVIIDDVRVTISTRVYALIEKPWGSLNFADSGQYFGYPDYYSFKAEQLRLYPAPSQNYLLDISGVRVLPETTSAGVSNSASNAWTNEAEALIRVQAKSFLYRNELLSPQLADQMDAEAKRHYGSLRRRSNLLLPRGKIRGRY